MSEAKTLGQFISIPVFIVSGEMVELAERFIKATGVFSFPEAELVLTYKL